jgi:hypothetical protein
MKTIKVNQFEIEVWDKDDVSKSSESLDQFTNLTEIYGKENVDVTDLGVNKIIIANGNVYSVESIRQSTFPWYRQNKRDFVVFVTNQFKTDWKNASKKDFDEKNQLYKNVIANIKNRCDAGVAYPLSKESSCKARKCEAAISSSGRGKRNDSRVYFGVFSKNNRIYLASIASQSEHHNDESDIKAVRRADDVLREISLMLKEDPL